MKNLGFNVFGREAMENFLKEHNLQDLQQAIAEQKEMDTIKQKAIADGTFMKAPNGKPTNLNERQWLQVRTTNFKNWFGDWENNPSEASKVVDENGEPLVVYHGTTVPFTTFNYKGDRQYSDGFYFTSDMDYAKTIASKKGLPIIMPVFLNIKNPLRTDHPFVQGQMDGIYITQGNRNTDGLIGHDLDTSSYEDIIPSKGTEYHVLKANQVKSATNNNGNFSLTDDDIQAAYDITEGIKPEYKGKLIYAQAGTGKSTIADNITVFDSDYILGQLLGVSTETAGFFFSRLSAEQRKELGKQYREAIKQKVADGYTVVTANESLLSDADVIVYNSTAEQTEERVNRADRAINNRYHAIDYHKSTLSKIKELKENDKENSKEYHALDGKTYLGDIISNKSNTQSGNSNSLLNKDQKTVSTLLREQIISNFLNEFGITVHTLNNYDGELPLFDALNRVINAKNPSDITEGVGYAIAFIMQGDPEMQRMIVKSHLGVEGDYSKRVPIINKTVQNLRLIKNSPIAREVLKEVGRQIAKELRENFGTPIEEVKSKKSIWTIIKNFFTKLSMRVIALGKRGEVKKQEELFVRDIISALGREDFSRIKGPRIKEGTTELAQRVDIETALREHPYEEFIIRKLGEHGIALGGSASIAMQGSLYRPVENPFHDIDFNAGDNSSKESLDKILPQIFPNGTVQYSHTLNKGDEKGDKTITYITLSEPFEIKRIDPFKSELYSKDGRLLGKRYRGNLELVDGVQGKILDFFTGPRRGSKHGFYKKTINGRDYLFTESNAALAAKILWARPKDLWDYKYFKKDQNNEIETFTTPQGEVFGFVDKDGNIYLDETKITPEHPIHEYTHLWDRALQQRNPELWNRGVELMKQTSLWDEILNNENYGKLWQAKGMPQEQLDNLIASEVHARLTGVEYKGKKNTVMLNVLIKLGNQRLAPLCLRAFSRGEKYKPYSFYDVRHNLNDV